MSKKKHKKHQKKEVRKMKRNKKELIEKTAKEFQKLSEDNKMFILGYMLGIQQERQKMVVTHGQSKQMYVGQ